MSDPFSSKTDIYRTVPLVRIYVRNVRRQVIESFDLIIFNCDYARERGHSPISGGDVLIFKKPCSGIRTI